MSVSHQLSGTTFEERLAFGQMTETDIARWLIGRGGVVLPVYSVEVDSGKGPRLFSADCELVAPDLLAWCKGVLHWIEAKHKSRFTWHRKTQQWTTGIDLHHYKDYLRVANKVNHPVWLMFLHRLNLPDQRDLDAGCPACCPTGLFGESLDVLKDNESHRHDNWGRHGMVYWNVGALRKLAPIEEFHREC